MLYYLTRQEGLMRLIGTVIFALALSGLAVPQETPQPKRRALIELFTSQG